MTSLALFGPFLLVGLFGHVGLFQVGPLGLRQLVWPVWHG